ncbi:hypothetical protein ACIF8W_17310 [Streptomyces sp. NPDC085639]|uniref:hypothetical protein n=1 Tax=Streptomyces sp. NPDC085639 TaxID=3365734 RepID=UPI0037D366BA
MQADTAWTDYVKALFDPHTLRKNFDAVLRRGDQVLDRAPAPADTGKFFVALTALPDGNSRLLAVGLDGNVWHTLRDGRGAWEPWCPVPGPKGAGSFPGDRVALAGRPDGSARLLVTTR